MTRDMGLQKAQCCQRYKMNEKKIIIGLSGGVDSSVAAFLLKEQGYKVTGCFMRSFDTDNSKRELEMAERTAGKLGIDFSVIDEREEFQREVVRYFLSSYIEGRTPNPCCICNRTVKWPALMKAMDRAGAELIATGHYAGVGYDAERDRYYIRRARFLKKDQSYALYNLTQEELSHTLMPLYDYHKEDVRELALRIGLDTAEKPDSQEICFIESGDYAGFIKEHIGLLFPEEETDKETREELISELRQRLGKKGSFVDTSGTVLGPHEGIINYTIGQRKGLGIALGRRAFVKEIRPETDEVVLASDEELYAGEGLAGDINLQLLTEKELMEAGDTGFGALVKIRYGDRGTRASLRPERTGDGELMFRISFEEPVRAVTPGQAAVFYDEDGRMLGGGTIQR